MIQKLNQKKDFLQIKNNIYRKVAPPAPDASPRPPPPLRIGLSSSRTLTKNSRIQSRAD